MLQSTLFLKQIRQVILKHLIALMARIAKDDKEKFDTLVSTYGGTFKLGAVEDGKNRDKLTALTRFSTNQRTSVSFDEVRDYQCLMSRSAPLTRLVVSRNQEAGTETSENYSHRKGIVWLIPPS
jgi:HSP90 family molecular chaperone